MAGQFLERRGRVRGWALRLVQRTIQNSRNNREVDHQREVFEKDTPGEVHPLPCRP